MNNALFLFELLDNSNDISTQLFNSIVQDIEKIDPIGAYLFLSLIQRNTKDKYNLWTIIFSKIKYLTISDLSLILHCIPNEKLRYHLVKNCFSRCIINFSPDQILKHFYTPSVISKIKYIIFLTKRRMFLDEILLRLTEFPKDRRLDLLEGSIVNSGVTLDNLEQKVDILQDIFTDEYQNSCEILGINPQVYT